jgi:ribosomal protein S13
MNQSKNNISGLVAEIADQIINEMSLKDRIKMANLDESQISKTNQLLILYIEGKLKFMKSL